MTTFVDEFVLLCFAGLMLWAAATDFRTYTIPNRLCLAALCLYPAYVLAMWDSTNPMQWINALLLAIAVFGCGIALFAAGAMGGGDVKLMALVALWAGPNLTLEYFFVMAMAGLVLAVYVTLRESVHAAQAELAGGTAFATLVASIAGLRYVPIAKLMIPYGVAIATGGLYVVARLLDG